MRSLPWRRILFSAMVYATVARLTHHPACTTILLTRGTFQVVVSVIEDRTHR